MLRRVIVSVFVIGLVAGLASAQTTGRIAGQVLDNEGVPLPGVTMQAESEALIGGAQIAITDADGRFAFNILPPGMYRVEAVLAGFQPAAGEVRVALNRVASITFNLVPEQFGGEIEVIAEVPVVDTTQVNTSVVFDQDYLQNAAIGAGGRDYLSIIGQAAGVVGTGNVSVYGSTEGENSYLIDGLNTTDPVTGTFGTNFNYDAIQEINFQTGGFEAEFGQATGGIVNLVTKSGGNEFSGSLDVRYRDESFTESGDHYDPDEQESLFRNVSGTLGGPIIRDKVWFFVSAENVRTERQNEGANFARIYKGWNYIGKVTWQASDSHRVIAKYTGDPAEIPGINSSQYVFPAASGTQEQGGDIYQAELNSVLTESLLLNAQVGVSRKYLDVNPTNVSDQFSEHYNEDTLQTFNGYFRTVENDRNRDEIRLNATYFVDDFGGAHELKAGAEYNEIEFIDATYYNGGGYFTDRSQPSGADWQDLNGDGFFNYQVTREEPLDQVREPVNSYGDMTTFYLQDAWRPHPNLTVKPGIRLDNVKLKDNFKTQIADMDRWQPRLGVAWDVFGNANHVIRASAGRFMDPTTLGIPSFASGVVEYSATYNLLEFYCNQSRGVICTADQAANIFGEDAVIPWTNWNGFEYVLIDNVGTTVAEPAITLDQAGVGNLEAPYAEEYILSYETQLAPETSLELSYVNKETEDIVEDTCSGNTWVYGDGDLPSLDDPSTWTSTAECENWLISNIPQFFRKYDGWIAKFESRQERFHFLASYTYSDSRGTNISGPRHYAYGDADFFPVNYYNMYGKLGDHREHRLKVNGYLLLPYDITLGFDGFYSAAGHQTPSIGCSQLNAQIDNPNVLAQLADLGQDASVLDICRSRNGVLLSGYDINLADRGSLETKSVWQLDLQVSKTFQVGDIDMTAVLTVQNLFDRELDGTFNSTVARAIPDESTDDPSDFLVDENGDMIPMPLGEPLSYWLPRRYELGFRIEF